MYKSKRLSRVIHRIVYLSFESISFSPGTESRLQRYVIQTRQVAYSVLRDYFPLSQDEVRLF